MRIDTYKIMCSYVTCMNYVCMFSTDKTIHPTHSPHLTIYHRIVTGDVLYNS